MVPLHKVYIDIYIYNTYMQYIYIYMHIESYTYICVQIYACIHTSNSIYFHIYANLYAHPRKRTETSSALCPALPSELKAPGQEPEEDRCAARPQVGRNEPFKNPWPSGSNPKGPWVQEQTCTDPDCDTNPLHRATTWTHKICMIPAQRS